MTTSADRPFWGRAADDWIAIQEPLHRSLYDALLDAVALEPGGALLDAGCGGGAVSAIAACRGMRVTGLDMSEFFIDVARRRVPEAPFVVGDLQALPFDSNAFDAVIGANSFQFAADRGAAMREAVRVVRPRGRVAIGVFDAIERCEPAKPIGAIFSLLGRNAFEEPGPFALSLDDRLQTLMRDAGLILEDVKFVNTPFTYRDADTAVRAFVSAGPGQQARLVAGEAALIGALRASLEPYRQPDGSYRLENAYKIGVGRKA